jgi:predicted GIY-YIG superfamily endonuclease
VDSRFKAHVKALHPKFDLLMAMTPVAVDMLPAGLPKRAVYLLSERRRNLYAGRTNRLRSRLREHGAPASDGNSASFAFLLAREATGMKRHKRKDCSNDQGFCVAFERAKARIRAMKVRYVEETDPTAQALLEIYVALATRARHNSFENH